MVTHDAAVCHAPGCVALSESGSLFCAVHRNVTIRRRDQVPIHCYACDRLIRIGQHWIVRAEGAYHATDRCVYLPQSAGKIPILPTFPEGAHL